MFFRVIRIWKMHHRVHRVSQRESRGKVRVHCLYPLNLKPSTLNPQPSSLIPQQSLSQRILPASTATSATGRFFIVGAVGGRHVQFLKLGVQVDKVDAFFGAGGRGV